MCHYYNLSKGEGSVHSMNEAGGKLHNYHLLSPFYSPYPPPFPLSLWVGDGWGLLFSGGELQGPYSCKPAWQSPNQKIWNPNNSQVRNVSIPV